MSMGLFLGALAVGPGLLLALLASAQQPNAPEPAVQAQAASDEGPSPASEPPPPQEEGENDLTNAPIPLRPGTYWVYREAYTEHLQGLDRTSEATTRFTVRGSAARLFIAQSGGFDPAPGPVEQGDDWISLGPWTGEDALPLPLEVGRSRPGGDGTGAGWTVEAWEEVRVPAGDFTALRCAQRTRSNVSILWIAPGIGVVRETQGLPGRRPEIERRLIEWGPRRQQRPRPTPEPSPSARPDS